MLQLHTTLLVLHAAYNIVGDFMQHTTLLVISCNIQHCWCCMQHATLLALQATCNIVDMQQHNNTPARALELFGMAVFDGGGGGEEEVGRSHFEIGRAG